MDIARLQQQGEVARGTEIDATVHRERQRRRRLWRLFAIIAVPFGYFWYRHLIGDPIEIGLPPFFREHPEFLFLAVLMSVFLLLAILPYLGAGKSPHTLLRPEDSAVRLADVVGASATKREAIDTLNIFLNHRTFQREMGGAARRGVLFAGPPGTGKTYLAKALAAEAGVPFLFVSASEFQSMFYGQTGRKIRTYFKALRKAARSEGGAIGFIEEFDAIGAARTGMGINSREGGAGIVNELLVQMQSFELPTAGQKFRAWFVERANRFLPQSKALRRPKLQP
ncbi:MAG TPA: ATPase, partial [Acidimicrobiaceae bacterium]|nr:ATPase [Acidimicrobiaceae bacterium]